MLCVEKIPAENGVVVVQTTIINPTTDTYMYQYIHNVCKCWYRWGVV